VTVYTHIQKNKRQSIFLVIIFTILVLGLGWLIGEIYGTGGASGIILATIIATAMNFTSYFAGDKIALAANGAIQVTESQAPELYHTLENLSMTAGLPMPALYIIEDDAPNAFATGRDPKHSSIAVSTGLLNRLSKTEIEGVLAHELSHIGNYDIRLMMITVVLVGLVMLMSDWLLRGWMFGGKRDRDSGGGQIALILFIVGIVMAILSPIIAQLIKLAVSRSREYLADSSGALLTRYPSGLADALEKISTADLKMKKANHATAHMFLANPFDPKVTKFWEKLTSTHPPIEERIARLRALDQDPLR